MNAPAWAWPWVLQSTAIAVVGLACLAAAREMRPRTRLRWLEALMLLALGGPWLLAWLGPLVPAPPVSVVSFDVTQVTAASAAVSPVASGLPSWTWLWGAGVVARLAWLATGILRIRQWRRAALPLDDGMFEEAVALTGTRAEGAEVTALAQPVAVGVREPTVLVPETLRARPAAERLAVYVHELRHVARGDVWVAWLEEALRTVVWPLPAVWMLVPHLRLAREQVVDLETVSVTNDVTPYVMALVWSADNAPARPSLAPGFLKRHQLLTRVASLTREVPMSRARQIAWSGVLGVALVTATTTAATVMPISSQGPIAIPDGPGPLERKAVLPSLDTPPPRRTLNVEPLLPAGATGGASFRVHLVVDSVGTVAEVRIVSPGPAATGLGGDAATRQAVVEAVRQWQFEAPMTAPMLLVTDVPVGDARVLTLDDTPVRVGGAIRPPLKVVNVPPVYPKEAKDASVQGVVILETVIEPTGDVSDVRLLRSIPLLDAAAMDAVRQWKYQPQPHRLLVTTTINFTLAEDHEPR